jgi:hypothetical protein
MYIIYIVIQIALFLTGCAINASTPSGNFPIPIKVVLSLSFVIAAFMISNNKKKNPYTGYVKIGMLFCFIGDIINLNIIPGINMDISTYLSITAFGLAHVFFSLAFIKTARSHGLPIFNKLFFIGIIFFWTVTISSWWFLVFSVNKSFLAYGVLFYGLWVSTMAAFSLVLMKIQKSYILTAMGAFMFIISDLFLAATGIGGIKVFYRDAIIWATYILALMGIIYPGKFIQRKEFYNRSITIR